MPVFAYFIISIPVTALLCVITLTGNALFPTRYSIKSKTDHDGVYYVPVRYVIPILRAGLPYSETAIRSIPDNSGGFSNFSKINTMFTGSIIYTRNKSSAIAYIKSYVKEEMKMAKVREESKYKISAKDLKAEISIRDVHS